MIVKVTATGKAKPEFRDFAKEEMHKLVKPSRLDKGCISYGMYSDIEDENTFVILEEWASKEDLDHHSKQYQLVNFDKVTKGKFESFTVRVLTENK